MTGITVTGERLRSRIYLASGLGVDSRCAAAGASSFANGCRKKATQRPQVPRDVAHVEDLHGAKL